MLVDPVVTRFAPSPTGNLHIGGARTALFNWAFARHHRGQFILRIEDTDRTRSSDQSTRQIIRDLKWLGLDWDQGPDAGSENPDRCQIGDHGPYFQSQRLPLYRQYADQLLEAGRAYECFKTPQELATERASARAEKRNVTFDPTQSKSLTAQQIDEQKRAGKPCVIRFAVPAVDIEIQDEVLGKVMVRAGQLEDFVILKSDGYPTYHLAVVVDDWLMGVTHVIRGQEHLNNAPKHAALQDALGFDRPRYAHIPLIFNPDGSKMSKRDKAKAARLAVRQKLGDASDPVERLYADLLKAYGTDQALEAAGITKTGLSRFLDRKSDDINCTHAIAQVCDAKLPEIDVYDFQKSGYLPQVVVNYLALLGWSPGQNIERFNREFLVQQFSLDRIGKSNARFDRDKLLRFNGEALAALSCDVFTEKLKKHLERFHPDVLVELKGHLDLFAAVYQQRSRTLDEPVYLGGFLMDDRIPEYDAKSVKKHLARNNGQGFKVLRRLQSLLGNCSDWTQPALEQVMTGYAKEHELSLNQIAQPLRIALSGSTVTPPIYDTLVLVGKGASLRRIDSCLEVLTKPAGDAA